MADGFPLVSAIVPAYNYARFLGAALDSALEQDYPADRLEIVVVDDGSADETPEVLAEYAARHPGRIRAIRQENAGNIVATNRAFAAARGELIAMLDADDTWLAHKTRAQVEIFTARPEVAVVHGDLALTDGRGEVTAPSLFGHFNFLPGRGRLLPELMASNQATNSAIMIRAGLRPYFDPIPVRQGITYYDWWLLARGAIAGEIEYLPEPCATYRIHGANDTGGATGARKVREFRRELAQQRWLLAHVELRDGLRPSELATLCVRLRERAVRLLGEARTPFVSLLELAPQDEQRARAQLDAGRAHAAAGDSLAAAHALARAYAWNPYDAEIAPALTDYLAQLGTHADAGAGRPPFLREARGFCTLAFAEELVACPALLEGYGRQFGAADAATLIVAVEDPGLVPAVAQAVEGAALDGADAAEVLLLGDALDARADAALGRAIHAVLTERPHDARYPAPHLGSGVPGALRALAERNWHRAA